MKNFVAHLPFGRQWASPQCYSLNLALAFLPRAYFPETNHVRSTFTVTWSESRETERKCSWASVENVLLTEKTKRQFYEDVKLEVTATTLMTRRETSLRQNKLRPRQKVSLTTPLICAVWGNKCPWILK